MGFINLLMVIIPVLYNYHSFFQMLFWQLGSNCHFDCIYNDQV